jgi:hypothetical protein
MLPDMHLEQDFLSLLCLLLQVATRVLVQKLHLMLALINYYVLQQLVQHCLLLCRWLTVFDLLDEKVVPMGTLGTSHIVTSIHIPAIKPTHFFWSFKVGRTPACCRLRSIAGTSPIDK